MCTAVTGRSCSELSTKVRQNIWVNFELFLLLFSPASCDARVSPATTPLFVILSVFKSALCSNLTQILDFVPVSLSEISILAAAVGGACGIILIFLGIVVVVRYCRRKHVENDIELQSREQEWKDSTMW